MSTVIYRLAVPEEPWYGQVNDFVRDMPGWAKVAGILAAPTALAIGAAVGVELAAAAGVVALGAVVIGAVGLDGPKEPLNIRPLTTEEAQSFRYEPGGEIERRTSYLPHPKLNKTLISASNYHDFIIREQSAHLLAYIRATVLVKRVCISISYGNAAEVAAKAPSFGFRHSTKVEGEIISNCEYGRPEQPAMPDNLYWMSHFPSVVEGLRQASKGRGDFKELVERSTHLDVAAAHQIGLDSRATRSYRLNIAVEFC